MRRRVFMGDAVYSTPHTNPPGPRLWSGNAADPQYVAGKATRSSSSTDSDWLWVVLAVWWASKR